MKRCLDWNELKLAELMLTSELNNGFLGLSAHMISCFGSWLQIVPKDEENVSEVGLKAIKHSIVLVM